MAENEDIANSSYQELQDIAGSMGIQKNQSKDKLIEAINADIARRNGESTGEGAVEGSDTDDGSMVEKPDGVVDLEAQLADANDRADAAEAKVESLAGRVAKDGQPTTPIEVEREIRRYVKKNGGLKKNLPAGDAARAKSLLKIANGLLPKGSKPRTVDDGWNIGIVVPGFESAIAKA